MNTTYLDVRLSDDYEAAHIPGAINNAVFEVQFNERMKERVPNLEEELIVYGANESSLEASMALEKLNRMGYQKASLLEGGFASWTNQGNTPQLGTPLADLPALSDGDHQINLEDSSIQWTGRNLLNKHWGSVGLKSGRLNFQNNQLTQGEIILNLTDLKCADLADSPLHDVLIAHLHNDDFLDLEKFPTAKLTIQSSSPTGENYPGAQNLKIEAQLTVKDITHPLTFEAAAGITPDGKAAAQAKFSIDRTKWGINYGSGKLFHRLGGHLVNDHIEFDVKIITL